MRQTRVRLFFLALSIFSFWVESARATVTVTSYSNVSEVDQSGSIHIVYAGTAGDNTPCSGTGLCNNCTGGLVACNRNRVTNNTELSIQFTSDSKYGRAAIAEDTNGNNLAPTVAASTSTATGQSVGLTIRWGYICAQIDSSFTNCETVSGVAHNGSVILRVGVDANNDGKLDSTNDDLVRISFRVQRSMQDTVDTASGSADDASNGIYDFTVYPGDEKVYLEDLSAWPGFPSSAQGTQYTKVHLLYYPVAGQNCGNMAGNLNNTFIEDSNKSSIQSIKTDGNLSDDRFFNLTNDQWYAFKVAVEDQAHNVGLFTTDGACVASKHIVQPGEVLGLLKENQNCFIATAAYGSPFSKYVQTFRNFRDQILLPTSWGKRFVRSYYNWGKPAAQVIKDRPWLKKLSQIALFPALGVANLALLIGPWATFVVGISFALSGLILLSWAWKRRRMRA